MDSQRVRDGVVARLRASGSVFAEEEADLLIAEAGSAAELESLIEQRIVGVPLEVIVGWAEFCGRRIGVEPGVFVPRRRTELLVAEAPAPAGAGPVVLDLCCGTGAVGAAIHAGMAGVTLHAADIDPAAVRCARRNLEPLGALVFEGDLFAPLPRTLRGTVDLLVVNAPYVPTDAIALMPPEARVHEARVALDGGGDGLDIHRRVAAGARDWLAPGGHLLIETSRQQASRTAEAFADGGLAPRTVSSQELDGTVVVGAAAS
ncbi:putative protein N(5)-glutamine methyltransferase [Aeromicrobium sp.]|uniref:putative protein N(5)-glutamine methyltransferase n=1 Tax=Aeromicrobium sp. TaxID=1871063 RepID=UPI0019A2BB1F|nr:putative protein N(5)-glutamine methyltransferase [Aeromicrobium sp.]MBC7630060.1 putative protein N(5)-glutamine methyltransferase [Aeromicrobium sp.]